MDALGLARKTEKLWKERRMNPITLLQPPRVVFGNGCAKSCVEIFAQRGAKRIFLVTSKSVRSQIEFLVEALKKSGSEVVEIKFVSPEPTLNFFEKILADARAAKIDSVLGIGGGSVLDIAKLIAASRSIRKKFPKLSASIFCARVNYFWFVCRLRQELAAKFRQSPFCWTRRMN